MPIPPACEAAHADLSPHNLDFVRAALADPQYLHAPNFAHIQERDFLTSYKFHNWPVLIEPGRLRAMNRVAEGLHRVLTSVPARFFGMDARKVAEYYGLRPDLAAAAVADPSGVEHVLGRSDYVLSTEGLKLLEYNCGFLGGWHFSRVAPMYLAHPLLRVFAAARGLRYVYRDTVDSVFEYLASRALHAGLVKGDELNVAFTLRPSAPDSEYGRIVGPRLASLWRTFDPREDYAAGLRQVLARLPGPSQGDVFYCSHADFELRQDGLFLHGRPVHAVYEYVGERTPQVNEAARSGRVHLYPEPVSLLLGDKRTIALVSEQADRGAFDARERRLIHAHVPWTRVLRAAETTYEGSHVRLPELVLRQRERFVLKLGLGTSGQAVHVGRALSQDEWAARVERALAQPAWVVQEFVQCRHLVADRTDGTAGPHDVVWGFFTFGGRHAGGFARLQPLGVASVINMERGARGALVFAVHKRRTRRAPGAAPRANPDGHARSR